MSSARYTSYVFFHSGYSKKWAKPSDPFVHIDYKKGILLVGGRQSYQYARLRTEITRPDG
jgi:hypothetical protein